MKKQSGLDIDLGNRCSQNAYSWAKKTFEFRKDKKGEPAKGLDGSFANSVFFGSEQIGISSDGIGTKIEIAERMQKYDTLGYDLVAMVADDLVANGFEPANLSNIIDVDFLDYDVIDSLMSGLYNACKKANIAVTGGEIAELGKRVCGYGDKMHFNWTATAIGNLSPYLKAPLSGNDILKGDKIVAIKSRGFRSNGFSLVRKILTEAFGEEWHKEKFSDFQTWGDVLLTPSLIYSPVIGELFKKHLKIKAVVHITGGGIPDNFSRVLKKDKLGADFYNLFPPHKAMLSLAELGKVDIYKLYRIWNMGNGMMLVVPSYEAEKVVEYITKNNFTAQICGEITDSGEITIDTGREELKF